jgi:hypothetical protein
VDRIFDADETGNEYNDTHLYPDVFETGKRQEQ